MMRGILTVSCFASAIFLPWPFTAFLALCTAFLEPLVPLSIGLFVDVLYYTPAASTIPLWTLLGAITAGIAFFVRSRLRTGIIRE